MEFERLGGTRTLRVHVRLVAATNRDLVQMIADHEFRSDLRELENLVERSVILSQGPVLEIPLVELKSQIAATPSRTQVPAADSLENLQRKHILIALDDSSWVIVDGC